MKNFLKNRIKNFLILLSILAFILHFDLVNANNRSLYETHIMQEADKKRIELNLQDGGNIYPRGFWRNSSSNFDMYSTSFFDVYYIKNNSYEFMYNYKTETGLYNNVYFEVPIEKTADRIAFDLKGWVPKYSSVIGDFNIWCLYDMYSSKCPEWVEYFQNPDISLEDKKERLKTEILDVFVKIWINPRFIDVGDEFDVFIEFEDDSIIVFRSYYFTRPTLYKKLILPPKSVKVANKNSITPEEEWKVFEKIKEANPDFYFNEDNIYSGEYISNSNFYTEFIDVSPKEVWQKFKKYWFYSFFPNYNSFYCLNFNKYWFNDLLWVISYDGVHLHNSDGLHESVECLDYKDMIYEEEPENTENTENTNPENLDNTNIENNNQNSENSTENITNNSSTENNQNNSSSSSNSWHGWYVPWIPTISNNNFENLEISNILNSAPQNPQNSNIILSDKIENKTNIIFDLGENTENSNSNYILSTFADNWNIEIPENPISDNKNTENKNPKFIQNSKIILPDYLPATWFEIIFVLIFSILSSFLIFRKNLKN